MKRRPCWSHRHLETPASWGSPQQDPAPRLLKRTAINRSTSNPLVVVASRSFAHAQMPDHVTLRVSLLYNTVVAVRSSRSRRPTVISRQCIHRETCETRATHCEFGCRLTLRLDFCPTMGRIARGPC